MLFFSVQRILIDQDRGWVFWGFWGSELLLHRRIKIPLFFLFNIYLLVEQDMLLKFTGIFRVLTTDSTFVAFLSSVPALPPTTPFSRNFVTSLLHFWTVKCIPSSPKSLTKHFFPIFSPRSFISLPEKKMYLLSIYCSEKSRKRNLVSLMPISSKICFYRPRLCPHWINKLVYQ